LPTTLTPAQEIVVVELRTTLLLSLDDLLVVTREFLNPAVSRSGLDRCLRRHGVANLKALTPQEDSTKEPVKPFKAYAPGFLQIDIKYLPQMPDEAHRRYLFVAIDRATRWVYVELRASKSATAAEAFLKAAHTHGPVPHREGPHRQRQSLHPPLQPHRRAPPEWNPPLRSALHGARHRASTHPSPPAPDQWQGRAL